MGQYAADITLVNGMMVQGAIMRVLGINWHGSDPMNLSAGLGFVDASAVTDFGLELRLDSNARSDNEGFTGAFAIGGSRSDLISSTRAAKIYGGDGHDTIHSSMSDDILIGDAGNDSLSGFDGNDTFTGGSGDDTIVCDDGSDTAVYSGNFSDYLIEELNYNQYRITDTRGAVGDGIDLVSGVNKLQFADQTIDVVIQGLSIVGDNSSEDFSGTGFADMIDGLGGNDTAAGADGNDWMEAGAGNDLFFGNADDDLMFGEAGNDLVYGGTGDDSVNGGIGNDLVHAAAGDDDLLGGAGQDTLYVGSGSDDFIFKAINEVTTSTTATDVIFDFSSGQDEIDLSAIDASTNGTANDTFVYRGTGAITTSSVGEVSFKVFNLAGTKNDYTLIYVDTDADRTAEAVIRLNGVINLTAGDFTL